MSNEIILSNRQLLDKRMEHMLKVVSAGDRERFRQAAIGIAMSKNLEGCTQNSIMSSIYYCFRWGFSGDPAMRQVAIIPFREKGLKVAKPIIMYNGVIDLARNADPTLQLRTGVVYANDEFELLDGTTRELTIHRHHWLAGKEPGDCLFAWCAYRTSSQSETELTIVPAHELFTLQEKAIEKTKGNTPWATNFPPMAEKTAILRSGKKWTLAPHSDSGKRLREVMSVSEDDDLPELDTRDEREAAEQPQSSKLQSDIDRQKSADAERAALADKLGGETERPAADKSVKGASQDSPPPAQTNVGNAEGGDNREAQAARGTSQGEGDTNANSSIAAPAPTTAPAPKGKTWKEFQEDCVEYNHALGPGYGFVEAQEVRNAMDAYVKVTARGGVPSGLTPVQKVNLITAVKAGTLKANGQITAPAQ